MKQLTTIQPPSLFSGASVQALGVTHEFSTPEAAGRFCALQDISIIAEEINLVLTKCVVLNCRIDVLNIYRGYFTDILALLKGYPVLSDMGQIVSLLSGDVSKAIDAYQRYSAPYTRDIVNQAKCLVVLFVTKYKNYELPGTA